MKVRTEFPRKISAPRDVFIPLSNDVRLAARIWLPEDAESDPVPAIMEYIPYRKRDGTSGRDAEIQSYFAGHGYAGVRVDMRGSGDSDGMWLGEYLKQEQDDAVEVIAWLAAQPWCSGSVGMMGISWGGFNSLQVAARRPPALKAIISACSTDDRYADDIHMMGGCLLTDKVTCGADMLSRSMLPPDPALVGDKWRDIWFERLENNGLWTAEWHEHQRRDDFYKHGSIREDYGAIECATYLVGGWMDSYSNAIFRMAEHLRCPRKALIGPWAHKFPYRGKPGPKIGFLQECVRWWDHWLKGRDTGMMDEPMLRAWMRNSERSGPRHDEWSGRWVAEESWPPPGIEPERLFLRPGGLAVEKDPDNSEIAITSPQTAGHTMGNWCPHCNDPDLPEDQRHELGHATVFDGGPLTEPVEVFGAPVARLDVTPDKKNALVAAVLSEVFPDGSATLISYGVLNLTHRDSHEFPEELEPGKRYTVDVRLNEIAHRFAAGNRIRLALSTSFWPTVWPSPEPVTLRLQAETCHLELPLRAPRAGDEDLSPFPDAEAGPPLPVTQIVQPRTDWTVTRDLETGRLTHRRLTDGGIKRLEDDWEFGAAADIEYSILPNDPLSACVQIKKVHRFAQGDWSTRVESTVVMTAELDEFRLHATLDCHEGERRVFSKNWDHRIPRDCL